MLEGISKVLCIMIAVALIAPAVSAANSVEIRGQISNEGSIHEWNASTFPAFWHNLKNDLRSETLTIDPSESLTSSDRDLDENHLTYTVQRTLKKYKVQSNKGLTVENGLNYPEGKVVQDGTHYGLVGFFGAKRVAVKGDTSKLTKLIFEQGDTAEKVLTVGETWDMGEGWTLTAEAIDARTTPRQAWLILKRGDKSFDCNNVLHPNEVCTYTEDIAGLTDVPLFVTYVDGILSSSEGDIVILKYTWLISTDIKNIKTSDKFGVFKVKTANDTHVIMKNEHAVSLDQNAVVDLAEGIQFKVADKSKVLRFYPRKVIKLESTSVEPEATPKATPKATPTETPEATPEQPVSTPTETTTPEEAVRLKEAVENQETTSTAKTPTETPRTPGFGILLAGFIVTMTAIVHKKTR